jgi:hypothetical protein
MSYLYFYSHSQLAAPLDKEINSLYNWYSGITIKPQRLEMNQKYLLKKGEYSHEIRIHKKDRNDFAGYLACSDGLGVVFPGYW